MDKSVFKDTTGNYITQGLFIDFRYDPKYAKYCLAPEDKEYDGVVYPSLKRLYLEMEDLTEYEFAYKYLCDWEHWERICENKILRAHVEKWREELEVKLRARAIKAIAQKAATGDFNSAKWIADRGWEVKRGRPSKQEVEAERKRAAKINSELGEDSARIIHLVKKEG